MPRAPQSRGRLEPRPSAADRRGARAARADWPFEVVAPALPAPVGIAALELAEAIDRPDRLELELVAGSREAADLLAAGGLLAPGGRLELGAAERERFRGRIDHVATRLDRGGQRWGVVAWVEYEERRRPAGAACYFEVTDSEVAEQLARELGLRPRVAPSRHVHARLERREERLRFLRRRSRRIGYELGVTGGDLLFAPELPSLEQAPIAVTRSRALGSLELVDRGPLRGRGGRIEVTGDPRWRPLASFELRGLGGVRDGAYRALRVRHRVDRTGYRCVVDFLERGADWDLWSGEGRSGAR